MDNFDQFDDYFKEGLHDFNVKPSAEIWDRMENSLPVGLPWYKNPYFRGTAILLASMFGIGMVYFISNYQIEASITKIEDATIAQLTSKKLQKNQATQVNPTTQAVQELSRIVVPFELPELANPATILEETTVAKAANSEKSTKKSTVSPVKKANLTTEPDPKETTESLTPYIAQPEVASLEFEPTELTELTQLTEPTFHTQPSALSIHNQQLLPNQSPFVAPAIEILSLNYKFRSASNEPEMLYVATTLPVKSIEGEPLTSSPNLGELAAVEEKEERILPEFNPQLDPKLVTTIKNKGWYAGTMYQTQSAWLINQKEAEETPEIVEDLDQNTQIGNAYGVVLGYNFGKSTGIQLEWIMNSQQDLEFETEATRITNATAYRQNLNYMLFPVLFKYSKSFQSKLTNKQMSFNHLVGFQYGYLNSAEFTVGGERLKSDWRDRSNLGLVVGMDYDVYFTRNAHLSLGARSTFGKSIYEINGLLENDRLYNVLLGLNASFRYRFNKDGK